MHLHFMQTASYFLDLTEFIAEASLSLDLLIHVFIPTLGQTVLFYLTKCKPGREGGRREACLLKKSSTSTRLCSFDQYLHQSGLNVCGSRVVHSFNLTCSID